MYRIDNATAATTLPTPGAVGPNPNGFFTDGNPASGIAATVVDDDWLNAVQEELCNAITSDGTALSKTNRTQLAAKLSGRLINEYLVTASATYTATAGAGVTEFLLVGGGGGGGAVPGIGTGSAAGVAAGGGGAGGTMLWRGPSVSVAGATLTVGNAGAGGIAGANTGNTGGTTSVTLDSVLAIYASGGTGGSTNNASTATIGCPGGGGGSVVQSLVAAGSVIWQAAGDPGGPGLWFAVTGGSLISGKGGGHPMGGGGNSVSNAVPASPQGHGGGGAGSSVSTSGSTTAPGYNGGAGSGGAILVREYS